MSSEFMTPLYRSVLRIACFAVVSLFAAWVLSANETDSPYISTEVYQQVYLTDEGLYTKGATWFSRHNELFQPVDFCIAHVIAPFYVLSLGSVFQVFGETWRVARGFSIFMSFLALGAFWSICRKSLPPVSCWLATVSVALAFQYLHSARLATADPFGIALCLLSAAAWVHWNSTVAGTLLALLLAVAAVLAKNGYGAFFGALAVGIVVEIFLDWCRQNRSAALAKTVILTMAAALLIGLLHYFRTFNPALASYLQQLNFNADLGFRVSIGTGIRYQLHSLFPASFLLPGVPVLLAAALFTLLSGNGRHGFRVQFPAKLYLIAADPVNRLFLLWAAGGVFLFGLTSMQGARYYLFLVFVISYLAFWGLNKLTPAPADTPWLALLVAILHLASQSNLYLLWAQQQPASSYVAVSRDIAARIAADNPGHNNVLAHGLSNWLALFDSRITGVDYAFDGLEPVQSRSQRLQYWRPRYVIVNEDDVWLNSRSLQKLITDNSNLLAGAELIAEYRFLFRNNYPLSPDNRAPNLKLLRLLYR